MTDVPLSAVDAPAIRKPRFTDALVRWRYKYVPDHVVGEILSKRWIDNVAPFFFLVITLSLFGILIPGFFEPSSLVTAARQLGEFGFVVLAMMVVMVAGGIDLSVGSNFALGNFVALASINLLQLPVGIAFLATLGACGFIGLLNGVLIGVLRLRAFLTTLVVLIIVRASVDMLLLKYAVQISGAVADSEIFDFAGNGSVLAGNPTIFGVTYKFVGIPFSFVALMVAVIVGHIILSRTRPGWRVMAVGGSRRSAHNAGISVKGVVCSTYVVAGLLVGCASFMYAARLSSAGADNGVGLELSALTAAILGGNSLGGGRGSAGKALMGAVIVLVIQNGVVRLGMQSGAGNMVLGIILVLAAWLDVHWVKNRHKIVNKVYVSPAFNALPEAPPTAANSGSPYAVNDKLREVEVIGLGRVEGPEDVIFDRDDHLYTGTRHGDIVRFRAPDYTQMEIFAHIGGHPLGMAFDKQGVLFVCVGGMGLYAVGKDGNHWKVTDETNRSKTSINDDSRLRLADDLDIAPDGRVFFSEATIRYEMHSWHVDSVESRGNGRIVVWDPSNNSTRTVIRDLLFPNGICTSWDGQSIFFCETWGCNLKRYYFDGPKRGKIEVVIDSLPGHPDNINRSSDGNYWLAIVGMRSPAVDLALQMPGFRRRMARRVAPDEWLYPNINTGCVVKFNEEGEILDALWDLNGTNHPMITSMREHKGSLFLGGISNNRIGRYRIPGADPNWSGPEAYWGKA